MQRMRLQVWIDFNSASARAWCAYGVRLWRKTPDRSKRLAIFTRYNFSTHIYLKISCLEFLRTSEIQTLKDILTLVTKNRSEAAPEEEDPEMEQDELQSEPPAEADDLVEGGQTDQEPDQEDDHHEDCGMDGDKSAAEMAPNARPSTDNEDALPAPVAVVAQSPNPDTMDTQVSPEPLDDIAAACVDQLAASERTEKPKKDLPQVPVFSAPVRVAELPAQPTQVLAIEDGAAAAHDRTDLDGF